MLALSMAPWPSSFGIPIPFFKQRRRESRQKPIFGHAAQQGAKAPLRTVVRHCPPRGP